MKKYFQFEELGTNYRREIIGGITTFLAMAYILVVNPITLTLADVPDLPSPPKNGLWCSICGNRIICCNWLFDNGVELRDIL